MKKVNITKRLLLVVTAFALIVCALTAVVGAQTDYEELFKVLEYFEEPIVADEDFEGEFNPADNVIGLVNGQTAEVVTDGDNSYLKLTLAADAADAATLMAKWNSAAGSASSVIMSLDFMLSADGGQTYDCLICGVVGAPVSDLMDIGYLACPSCYMGETDGFLFINDAKLPNFSVYVNEDEDGCDHTDAHDAGKLLFELNPYNNIYTYANGNSTSNVTFSYSAGTWLTLEVVMLDGEYTLNIKDAAGTVLATQTDVDFPVDEIASVKMGSLNGIPGQQNINGVVSVDNVYVQGGTYLRNDADKQTVTESALVDLAAAYKTETDETTRDELLSVFNRIITLHGFTTTNAEVNAAVAELSSVAQMKFSEKFVVAAGKINAEASYTDRVAISGLASEALSVVPTDLSALSDAQKTAHDNAVAALNAELTALAGIKNVAEAYIALADSVDTTCEDYEVLAKICEDMAPYAPDMTYPGVTDAKTVLDAVVKKTDGIKKSADSFIAAVGALEAAQQHDERVEKYLAAKKAYYTNETYVGVTAAMEKFATIQLALSYDQIKVFADTIDLDAGYAKRMEKLNSFKQYRDLIPSDPADITDEAYKTAAQAYDAEIVALAAIDAQTRVFIAEVDKLSFDANVYSSVKAAYDAIKDIAYDSTHPDAKQAHTTYVDLKTRIDNFEIKGGNFIKFVAAAGEATDFATKYENYTQATVNYFSNTSYPGIEDAMVAYAALKLEITPVETQAKKYLAKINSAKYAMYLSAKEAFLDEADAFVEGLELNFPGIAEAQTLYTEIRNEIASKKAAAAAYVAAVAAIEGKSGQALVDAINAALAAKETGDVSGVPGVVEANIALSNAVASLEVVEGYNTRFVELVALIAEAQTAEERFNAILSARAIEAKADAANTAVAAAKTTLANAVNAHNTAANSANDTFADVNDVAASVATGATAQLPEATLGKVVALIKKIFE